MAEKVILAYSGGLDTSVAIRWIKEKYGMDVITRLREWTRVPIIFLSVREREADKISALDAGADDYLTKPFSMGELLARIRVAIRHVAKSEDEPVLAFGDLTVDLARRQVLLKGGELRLTPTEYELLKYLALHSGRVVTHGQLLRTVWGPTIRKRPTISESISANSAAR